MAQEINLGGTIYVSSKRAAEITGYSQDYVGQLARSGAIEAQRVSGLWYVLESSIREHKEKADAYVPEPPRKPIGGVRPHSDTAISFDGRDYVSASRAAKLTGYSQDYVGQLARSGKILSRQIGNRWYVDRAAVIEHKKHNDALLAAVQRDAVGLQPRPLQDAPAQAPVSTKETVHFTYVRTEQDLIPAIPAKKVLSEEGFEEEEHVEERDTTNEHEEKPTNQIPIRVLPTRRRVEEVFSYEESARTAPSRKSRGARMAMYVALFLVTGSSGFFGYMYFKDSSFFAREHPVVKSTFMDFSVLMSQAAQSPSFETAQSFFSKELVYDRSGRAF